MITLTPQAIELYSRLMNGRLINREKALKEFGCKNLTARISELRKSGIRFCQYDRYFDTFCKDIVRDAHYYMKVADRKYNKKYIDYGSQI